MSIWNWVLKKLNKKKPEESHDFKGFNLPPEKDTMEIAAFSSKDENIFTGFPNEENLDDDQQWRMVRADDAFIYIDTLSSDGRSAVISGKTGELYHTSFSSCDCEDYQKRHKPCKHMYKLAFYTNKMRPEKWCHKDHEFKNIHNAKPVDRSYGNNMAFQHYRLTYIDNGKEQAEGVLALTRADALKHSDLYKRYQREPDKLELVEYERPTELQILYAGKLGQTIPGRCSKEDLHYLLSGGDIHAEQDAAITDYLKRRRINFSYYASNMSLLDEALSSAGRVEFLSLIIVLLKWTRTGSYDFSHLHEYREFSRECLRNTRFLNSYKRNDFSEDLFEHPAQFFKNKKNTNFVKILNAYLDNQTEVRESIINENGGKIRGRWLNLAICLTEDNGMLYHGARLSSDYQIFQQMRRIATDKSPMGCFPDTLFQFPGSHEYIFGIEDFSEIPDGGFFYDETIDPAEFKDIINEIYIIRWNKPYVNDMKCTLDLSRWQLVNSFLFNGSLRTHKNLKMEWYKIKKCDGDIQHE